MQPDVAPAPRGDAVAEPLVGQLVRDQPLRAAAAVAVVGAEDRNPLCLKGNLEIVLGHHHGVAVGQRVGAEQLDEQLHHLRLTAEVVIEVVPQAIRQRGLHRHRRLGQLVDAVHADLQGDQIGRRRLGLFVGPHGLCRTHPTRHQLAVGDRPVRTVGADLDAVAGLGAGVVVAREPRRRAVGLAGHQDAVGQLLETDLPPIRFGSAAAIRRSAPRSTSPRRPAAGRRA